jgi:hypothetical protein
MQAHTTRFGKRVLDVAKTLVRACIDVPTLRATSDALAGMGSHNNNNNNNNKKNKNKNNHVE